MILKYLALIMVFLATWLLVQHLAVPRIFKGLRTLAQGLQQYYHRHLTGLPLGWKQNMGQMKAFGLSSAGMGLILGLLLSGLQWTKVETYVLSLLLGFLGLYLPGFWLQWLKKRRLKKMEAQLPDVLEMIMGGMKAGLSLVQALETTALEAPLPMARELQVVVRDCRLGLTPEDALEKMLARWPNPDWELFVIAGGVSLRTGANLPEVTERLIATIRERFRLRTRVETLTAQGRLSGWVVGLLPVFLAVGLTLFEPELMLPFFKHPLGLGLLGICVVLELLGAYFIHKVANIKL